MRNAGVGPCLRDAKQHSGRTTGVELRPTRVREGGVEQLRHAPMVAGASVLARNPHVHPETLEGVPEIEVGDDAGPEQHDPAAPGFGQAAAKEHEGRDSHPAGDDDRRQVRRGRIERGPERAQTGLWPRRPAAS